MFIMKLDLAKCTNRLGTENAFIVLVGLKRALLRAIKNI